MDQWVGFDTLIEPLYSVIRRVKDNAPYLCRNFICRIICLGFLLQTLSGETTIRQEKNLWRISQSGEPSIESQITEDGSLASLRFLKPSEIYNLMPNAHRPDFLKTGIGLPEQNSLGGSRGIFFWQNQPVPLHKIEKLDAQTIRASSDKGEIVYDFSSEQAVNITAINKSVAPMLLLMVLDSTVAAVRATDADLEKTPTIRLWPETIWYQDGNTAHWRIEITGGDRIWGPASEVGTPWREGLYQVWEAKLQPGETREVSIHASRMTDEAVAEYKALIPESIPARRASQIAFPLAPQANDNSLSLYSPKDYQVFQRTTQTQGSIRIEGSFRNDFDHAEARVTGRSAYGSIPEEWMPVEIDSASHGFSAKLRLSAGGWYQVEIRAWHKGKIVAQTVIEHVGIGEVFVTCGQSNSTNYGATEDARNRTQTGLVASFGGGSWQLCEDPLPGSCDGSQGGSPWTFFGDAMVRRYKVPVGIAITGQGGAPVQNWTPGSFPFLWLMARINQFGPRGFRALLWHQGESNVRQSTDFYYDTLKEIIEATRQVAGWEIPWMVAQTSYHNPKESSFASTRNAQQKLWEDGFAMQGPDTDTLTGADRAGIHLSTRGLQKHGEMWADCISNYLDESFKSEK
ncbi:sialate O-acetylesterase [Coraliomargarita parva]|uniref:sialate O-acetylesterase n=1 Tax=Coraliomargarita parva TaxID=3014050 RepID=UPI0022B5773F|nr:sialate O-acetylesterase [Coraliomargarita parva]